MRAALEECDDGNATEGDACSSACGVLDQLVDASEPAPVPSRRSLGQGRHPVALDGQGISVVYLRSPDKAAAAAGAAGGGGTSSAAGVGGASADEGEPSVEVARFSVLGVPQGAPLVLDEAPALDASHPVVAALPDQGHVAVWTAPDQDETGVWMRRFSFGDAIPPAAVRVNLAEDFGQFEPDALWDGSQLVVAWVDGSSLSTGYDLRYRLFSSSLAPLSGELSLAETTAAETHVALAPFAGSWAAAWRAALDGEQTGLEELRVQAGGGIWSVGPIVAGPSDDRPALAELDEQHLLLVFSEGVVGEDEAGPPTSRLRLAILPVQQPGPVALVDTLTVDPFATEAQGLPQSHPNVVRAGDHVLVSWRTEAVPGDARGEELWLKELGWSPPAGEALGSLDLATPELPLPRQEAHRGGDQRRPALAASLVGDQPTLVAAWDDLGQVFAPAGGDRDVVVEVAPLPLLRGTP